MAPSPPPDVSGGGGQASQAGDAVLLGSDGMIPSDLLQQTSPFKRVGSFGVGVLSFNDIVRQLYSYAKSGDSVILTVHRSDGLDILFIGTIGTCSLTTISIGGWGILRDKDGMEILNEVYSNRMAGSRATYYGDDGSDQTFTLENGEGDVEYQGSILVFSV